MPRNRATVMLVIDVSLSMQATDVAPTRLAAAQAAAKAFADQLTPGVNLGLVSFAGTAAVLVSPTTDREPVKRAVDGLQARRVDRHRRGDLRGAAVDRDVLAGRLGRLGRRAAARPDRADVRRQADRARRPGAEDQPRGAFTAARKAAEAHVPVSTISFGTDYGTIELDADKPPVSVAVDDESMRRDRRAVGRAVLHRGQRGRAAPGLRPARRADRLRDAQGRRQQAVARGRRAAARRRASARASGWAGACRRIARRVRAVA